jgi:hypothetical protein
VTCDYPADAQVYPVLKHYHIWEPNEDLQMLCTNVVEVIITPEMEDVVETENGDLRDVELTADGRGLKEPVGPDGKALPPRTFHVGAPEGVTVTWRPDHKIVDISDLDKPSPTD